MLARTTLIMLLAGTGCSKTTTQQASPLPITAAENLADNVGHIVTLRGRFGGPGKIADYVAIDGESVYLTGDSEPDATSTKYGAEVTVRGVLEHYIPPSPSDLPDNVVQPPEYYFIESAKLVR